MSLHNKPEHNTPPIVEALKEHGLKYDGPSQLADAFRLGYCAALASKPPAGEQKPVATISTEALEQLLATQCACTTGVTLWKPPARAGEVALYTAPHPEPVAPPAREQALRIADAIDPFTRTQAPDHLTMGVGAKLLRELSATPPAQAVQDKEDAERYRFAINHDDYGICRWHKPPGHHVPGWFMVTTKELDAARTRGNGVEPS